MSMWLSIKELTVHKMMKAGADPEVVLWGARSLIDKDGEVQSDVFKDAILYVTEKKFANVSNDKLREMVIRDDKSATVDSALANLECVKRGVKL